MSARPFVGVEPPELAAIPGELRELDQWVLWRFGDREGKQTKAPWQARNPRARASSTNPATWASFDEAVAAFEREHGDGLGFVFTADDPFFGVDLDGELSEADKGAVLSKLDTYSERSVSGAGFHAIGRGRLPKGGRHPAGIGVFDRARFFVVTGDHVRGTPTTIEDRQAELEAVLERFLPKQAERPAPAEPQPVDVDDEELLERARRARNGADFERLWRGDTSGYPSHSEADLALCSRLAFWTGRDPERVDRLFRASGLVRPKWDERRGDSTYGAQTIDEAIAGCRDVYEPARRASTPAPDEEPAEPFRIDVYTAKALCDLPPPPEEPELVGPFLRRGRITLIGATTGHGKTTFGAQMLAAGVLGGDFLGWDVEGGLRVLVLDLEQHLEDIREQLDAVGLADSELVDYAPIPEGLQIDRDREQLEELERVVAAKPYDVVRVDPFYKLHAADSSEELQARGLVRLTRRWVHRHGFALLMDTHTRKRIEGRAGFTLDDLFGSSLFARDPEVILGLQLIEDGFSRLHVFKARGRRGDIRTGQTLDLLYSDDELFRRKPDEADRDLRAELLELGADYAWRTLKEWKAKPGLMDAAPATPNYVELRGGIGAGEAKVKATLGELQVEEVFEYAEGPVGRSAQARCWRLRPTAPEAEGTPGQSGQSGLFRDSTSGTAPLTPTPKGSAVVQGSGPSTALEAEGTLGDEDAHEWAGRAA